ncbi:MAG: SEL1-like repeat protein [Elusimicrobia bacterium]|nr:SEL1-like repeat protein [Elusimicrobiota bacterium]
MRRSMNGYPRFPAVLLLAAVLAWQGLPAIAQEWPDLSKPAPRVGGGGSDAAVIVGIEDYAFVPDVPGAGANAKAWFDYLTETRGVPPQNIRLLTGMDATADETMDAVHSAGDKAGQDGTLWFVFVGHGAPAKDGQDGLLVAVDAQQKAKSLERYSVRRSELLKALAKSKAGSIRVILDACFSGRVEGGGSLAPGLQPLVVVAAAGPADSRMTVLTAAKGDQFAGALPGEKRPAFSYLVLGGLRGWATAKAVVTGSDLWRYASDALEATLRGRDQTPDLIGDGTALVAASPGEKGPDLAGLSKATAGGSASAMFQVSALPAVPKAEAPKALSADSAGLDFRQVDVAALKLYEHALELDKGDGSPENKAETWKSLGRQAPRFLALAEKRASEWEAFSAQRKAASEVRQKALKTRDEDWAKLSDLLGLKVVSEGEKKRWAVQFAETYIGSTGITYEMGEKLRPLSPILALMAKACDRGEGTGCAGLGTSRYYGYGTDMDPAKGAGLWRKACDLGDLQSCYDLGDAYSSGRGIGRDLGQAAGLYRKACDGDLPIGCANLGYVQENGFGLDKDETLAAKSYGRACALGYNDSCVSAGFMHEFGKGVAQDDARAAELYRQGCDSGVGRGCSNLGVLQQNGKGVPRDSALAVESYRKACETHGDGRGCSFLGGMHQSGSGVARDEAATAGFYRKACDASYCEGCKNLGVMHENGLGVARDAAKAVQLYRKACDAGYQYGCAAVGVMYHYGRGVAQSFQKAAELYRIACDAGAQLGCSGLAGLYAEGTGLKKDEAKAFELLSKSCDAGDLTGCVNAGILYLGGRGVAKNESKAAALFAKGCDGGDGHGCFSLGAAYDHGQGVGQDESRAVELYKKACGMGFAEACKWVR